jgi:prevent-host-death family protein
MTEKQVTIKEAARDFTKIARAVNEDLEYIVTRRGTPVLSITSYNERLRCKRRLAYLESVVFGDRLRREGKAKGLLAADLIREAREDLEGRA